MTPSLAFCGLEEAHGEHLWEKGLCIGLSPEQAREASRRSHARPFVRIAPEAVVWGSTLCSFARCVELAECLLDGWPFCIVHADETLDRQLAAELNPEAAALMPPLEE